MSSGPSALLSSLALARTGPSSNMEKSMPRIVVLGMTGDGKSNLGTWLLGDPHCFIVSDSAESVTHEPKAAAGKCFGGRVDYCGSWLVVDTPGLSDSAGRDAQNLRTTIDLLKTQVQYANAFVLVVNAQQDRMSSALKNTIKVFRGCFGPQFWANLCVVFTKWNWGQKFSDFTSEKLATRRNEWRRWFRTCEGEYAASPQTSLDLNDIQFFAVDLPSLSRVMEYGEDAMEEILTVSSSTEASTAAQLRELYYHLEVILPSKSPVPLQTAVAKTDILPDEVHKSLRESEQNRQKLEAEAAAAAKEAKEREARLKKELEEAKKAEEEKLAAQQRRHKEELERLDRLRAEQELLLLRQMMPKPLAYFPIEPPSYPSRQYDRYDLSPPDSPRYQPPISKPSYLPRRNDHFDLSPPDYPRYEPPVSKPSNPPRNPSDSISKYYGGGQFLPGGGRAPAGGVHVDVPRLTQQSITSTSSSSRSNDSHSDGKTFYKGGQFLPGGGRAPKGGCYR